MELCQQHAAQSEMGYTMRLRQQERAGSRTPISSPVLSLERFRYLRRVVGIHKYPEIDLVPKDQEANLRD